jgi:hypothetical protein
MFHEVSVFIWIMIGLALWHFTVLVPDRFWGGISGALLADGARLERRPAREPTT